VLLQEKFALFSIVVFKTLDISQGIAATNLRCGIFSDNITVSFILILTVK